MPTKQKHADLYVGIMSGTSLDGIDAALLDLSASQPRLLATHYQAYAQPLKDALLALHTPDYDELHQAQLIGNELARLYAAATMALLQTAGISAAQVRAIGCHGQTIRHRPQHSNSISKVKQGGDERTTKTVHSVRLGVSEEANAVSPMKWNWNQGYSVQLGNAALLAELSGITVVADFRSRDIAAGGQGAPLVPAFHDRVLRHPAIHRVIVNIGGISNLTNLPPNLPTTGFDCGPGNLLMDAWIAQQRGEAYDRDGAWAASGHVISALLQALLDEPFLHASPPKSSGRDLFNLAWLNSKLHGNEVPADVQATLLALTSRAIADAIDLFCIGAQEIYLCGGGARNQALVQSLRASLPKCLIQNTDALGMDADYLEASAFAWLAQQAICGHSANLPAVTGAHHPCILGAIYQM